MNNGYRRSRSCRLYSERLLGSFKASSLEVFLNAPSSDVHPESPEWLTVLTLLHETSHWYQQIGTGIGLLSSLLQDYQFQAARAVAQPRAGRQNAHKPLCKWIDDSNDHGTQNAFDFWKHSEFVDELFDGIQSRPIDYLGTFVEYYLTLFGSLAAAAPLHDRAKFQRVKPHVETIFKEMHKREQKKQIQGLVLPFPNLKPNEQQILVHKIFRDAQEHGHIKVDEFLAPRLSNRAFGAVQLREGASRCFELRAAINFDNSLAREVWEKGLLGDYRIALDYFMKSVDPRPEGDRSLVLFLAACELALNPPIHPVLAPDCLTDKQIS